MHIVAKEKGDEAGQWLSAWLSSEISYYGIHGRICLILGYTCLCNQHIYKLLNSSPDLSILFHGCKILFIRNHSYALCKCKNMPVSVGEKSEEINVEFE